MKKLDFSPSGFTLVETLIASSLLALLVLGSMAVFNFQFKASKGVTESVEFETLVGLVQSVLDYDSVSQPSTPGMCGAAFGNITYSNGVLVPSLNLGSMILKPGQKFGSGSFQVMSNAAATPGLKITQRLPGFGVIIPDPSSGNWGGGAVPANPPAGPATTYNVFYLSLQLNVQDVSPTGVLGATIRSHSFPFIGMVNSVTGKLDHCYNRGLGLNYVQLCKNVGETFGPAGPAPTPTMSAVGYCGAGSPVPTPSFDKTLTYTYTATPPPPPPPPGN